MRAFLIGASGILLLVAIVATIIFTQQKERARQDARNPHPTTVRNCHEVGQLIAAAEARNETIDRPRRENWLYVMYNDTTMYINATVDSLRGDTKHAHPTLEDERAAFHARCRSSADDQNFVPPPNNPHFRVIAKH